MSAHTPGPWRMQRFGMADSGHWSISGPAAPGPLIDTENEPGQTVEIAKVYGYTGYPENARLIAAAPALLAALRELVSQVGRTGRWQADENAPRLRAAWDAARAGIAAAEGRTP